MKLKDIIEEERPRERLLKYGEKNISNEELIAIILKTGTKDISVKKLAENILQEYKDIKNFKNIRINNLVKLKGIKQVKAIELISAIELGRRVYTEEEKIIGIKLNNAEVVYNYFKNILKDEKQECFYVVFLDNKKKIINYKLIFKGTINKAIIHPREIFKESYLNNAVSIICIHNHPSGDVTPSIDDINITEKLYKIGELQNIKLNDHIIVSANDYYSFYEKNHDIIK